MLQFPGDPNGIDAFRQSWLAELRAGYTPPEEQDLHERLCEYLDDRVSDADVQAMETPLAEETRAFVLAEQEAERLWPEVTENDALTAAFASLDKGGVLARECFGTSLEDGWARVGLEVQATHSGAVFAHQQDVLAAIHGEPLLVAFDGCGATAGTREERGQVARRLLDALAAHGVAASWSGDPDDRVRIEPLSWRRRRFTAPPADPRLRPRPWEERPRTLPLWVPRPEQIERFAWPARAYRTTYGFDVALMTLYRGAWRSLGAEWGQAGVVGLPHTFVPAGGLVTWIPRDALRNLEPDRAAALRAEGIARRPVPIAKGGPAPAAGKPWWRVW